MSERCPATTRHIPIFSTQAVGLQCRFTSGHDGDHCGSSGLSTGDVFWPQATENAGLPDEDRIREAMAVAQEHPGRIVTR